MYNQTLWNTLNNGIATSLPEVSNQFRKPIHDVTIPSVCLITGNNNPADSMTKSKPNKALEISIKNDKCTTPPSLIFMLQTSPYRRSSWIPTAKVPMPDDSVTFLIDNEDKEYNTFSGPKTPKHTEMPGAKKLDGKDDEKHTTRDNRKTEKVE